MDIDDSNDSAITLREVGRVSACAWECTLMQRSLLYFCLQFLVTNGARHLYYLFFMA